MRSSKAALNAPKSRMQHLLVCARLEYQNAYPSTHGRDEDVKARIDNPTCDFLMKTKASRNQVEIFFKALRAQHTLLFYTKCDAQGGVYVARSLACGAPDFALHTARGGGVRDLIKIVDGDP